VTRLRAAARPTLEHLLGVGLVVLAAVPWLAVTGTRTGLVHLGAAVAGATVVSLLLTRVRRVTVSTELLVSGLVLAGLLLVVVVGDVTGGVEVLRGLRDGVPRILSTGLPLLDVPWAGVPGAVAVWSTAAVVASSVARTRSVAGPAVAPLACFLAGYALTLGGRTDDVAATATTEALLLAALVAVLALVRRFHAVPGQRMVTTVVRSAGAVLIVLVAVGLGALTADRGPYVADEPVRPRLTPAAIDLEPESPLLVTRRLRAEEPERVVGELTVRSDWSGYVPTAVLDRYDGRVWGRTSDELLPTGGSLAVSFPLAGGPEATVRDLDVVATGGWLPYVGRVERLEGTSVLHDAGEVFQLAEPVATTTYGLRAGQPTRTLEDDELPDDRASARQSGLVLPLDVVRRASETRAPGERVCRLLALTARGEGSVGGGELGVRGAPCGRRGPDRVGFLRSLAEELSAGRAIAIDEDEGVSAGGPESLADLLELVGPPSAEGRSTGAPEQFAAAYALIADHYGLPVRLVTGFRVEDPVAGGPVPLRGEDAWTWVEVAVEDAGWVVVDPTPSAEDVTGPDDLAQPDQLEQPDTVPQEAPAELGVEPETVVVGPPPPPEPNDQVASVVLVAAGLLALVLLPLVVAAARRVLRRRRRRRGDARHRVVGAWHELLDVAHDVEVEDVRSRTTEELVEALAGRDPGIAGELAGLGVVVDRAVYSTRPVDEEEADRAWQVVRDARRRLRRSLRRRERLATRWRVAPRSLTSGPRPPRRRRGASAGAGSRPAAGRRGRRARERAARR
jgi:hypothetical protein